MEDKLILTEGDSDFCYRFYSDGSVRRYYNGVFEFVSKKGTFIKEQLRKCVIGKKYNVLWNDIPPSIQEHWNGVYYCVNQYSSIFDDIKPETVVFYGNVWNLSKSSIELLHVLENYGKILILESFVKFDKDKSLLNEDLKIIFDRVNIFYSILEDGKVCCVKNKHQSSVKKSKKISIIKNRDSFKLYADVSVSNNWASFLSSKECEDHFSGEPPNDY